MSNSIVFSIIVPVYNAEKYITEAVDAILAQTFSDFELLIVDDCSSDNSYSIIQQLAQKDDRIKVLQTSRNMGASGARNVAILKAVGQYICFLDSDDSIEKNLLERAHNVLKKNQVDCLKFGAIEEYYDSKDVLQLSKVHHLTEGQYDNQKDISTQIIEMEMKPLFGYLWNTMYKAKIIKQHNLMLDETLRVNEDFEFNTRFFKYVHTLYCLDYPAYHYKKRINNSLSSQKSNYSYDVNIKKIKALLDYAGNDQDNLAKVYWLYTRFVYSALESGEIFGTIQNDLLYKDYIKFKYNYTKPKKRILVSALQSECHAIILIITWIIKFFKNHLSVLFAKFKG